MITWPSVVLVDKSLHCVETAVQTAILDDVETQVSVANLGTKYDLACKYLAAHMATLYLQGDAQAPAGPIASETVGPISRSYASMSGGTVTDAWLASTKHGLAYLRIVRGSLSRLPIL